MNKIEVTAYDFPLPSWSGAISCYALKVLDEMQFNNWELSVLLCGDKTITGLNRQYRGKEEATDVLSFSLDAEIKDKTGLRYLPGDVIISLETLRENSLYFQTPAEEEFRRLLIHGILHLSGMDHKTIDKDEPMLVLQEEILKKIKNDPIIPDGGLF